MLIRFHHCSFGRAAEAAAVRQEKVRGAWTAIQAKDAGNVMTTVAILSFLRESTSALSFLLYPVSPFCVLLAACCFCEELVLCQH